MDSEEQEKDFIEEFEKLALGMSNVYENNGVYIYLNDNTYCL